MADTAQIRESLTKQLTDATIALKNQTITTATLGEKAAVSAQDAVQATVEGAAQMVKSTIQQIENGVKTVVNALSTDPTSTELI